MYDLSEIIKEIREQGYEDADAQARVCQDIVLKAISGSSLNRNVTVKGGVVMRSITQNIRRATQDMDIDFIRYSLSDHSIDTFVEKLAVCMESYIFSDSGMRENNISDVVRRVRNVFADRRYRSRVDFSDKRWLDDDIGMIFEKILSFLEGLQQEANKNGHSSF